MITKYQPGDLVRSDNNHVHLIWAVCDDTYYYEVYYKGKFKSNHEYRIKPYDMYNMHKLSKLALALI